MESDADMDKDRKPIVEGLFTWPSDDPRLMATRCKTCNTYYFPRSGVCQNPACKKGDLEDVTLSRRGKVWTYTHNFYQPPPPFRCRQPFASYGVVQVELPEGIRVLGMMADCPLEDTKIGMDVEMIVEPMYEDEQGNEFLTWKFRRVSSERGD